MSAKIGFDYGHGLARRSYMEAGKNGMWKERRSERPRPVSCSRFYGCEDGTKLLLLDSLGLGSYGVGASFRALALVVILEFIQDTHTDDIKIDRQWSTQRMLPHSPY